MPRETGGTVVSSALVLMDEIIKARYSPSEWEHLRRTSPATGDNWHHDSGRCRELLTENLLPVWPLLRVCAGCRGETESVGRVLAAAGNTPQFAMRKVSSASQIYPVFRELFKKEGAAA